MIEKGRVCHTCLFLETSLPVFRRNVATHLSPSRVLCRSLLPCVTQCRPPEVFPGLGPEPFPPCPRAPVGGAEGSVAGVRRLLQSAAAGGRAGKGTRELRAGVRVALRVYCPLRAGLRGRKEQERGTPCPAGYRSKRRDISSGKGLSLLLSVGEEE